MNTGKKSVNIPSGGADILNSRGGSEGECAMYGVTDQTTRIGLLRGSAAMAMAAAIAPIATATRPAMAQPVGLIGRDLLRDKRPVLHEGGTLFGAYDPYGDFSEEQGVATEHLFLPWEDVELEGLIIADDYARERNRKILITIEPWSWALDWNVTEAQLRDLILGGFRDENMRSILRRYPHSAAP